MRKDWGRNQGDSWNEASEGRGTIEGIRGMERTNQGKDWIVETEVTITSGGNKRIEQIPTKRVPLLKTLKPIRT